MRITVRTLKLSLISEYGWDFLRQLKDEHELMSLVASKELLMRIVQGLSPDDQLICVRNVFFKIRSDFIFSREKFSTQQIVDSVAWAILCKASPIPSDWVGFFDVFRDIERSISDFLPLALVQHFPLNEDVAKLIYAEISGAMPFMKDYILKNYEKSKSGVDYLLYPSFSGEVKRLVVFFSGNVGRKTYNRYSWYWDEKEQWVGDSVYLFLNDIDSHWYVGKDGDPKRSIYAEIIRETLMDYGLPVNSAITVGGSMGGYAAILFAVELNLGAAIAVHPQIGRQSALRYKEDSWERKIRECGDNFRELPDEIYRYGNRPAIYLEHGSCPADISGVEDLLMALRYKKSLVVLHRSDSDNHLTDNPSKQQVESLIDFFEGFDSGV